MRAFVASCLACCVAAGCGGEQTSPPPLPAEPVFTVELDEQQGALLAIAPLAGPGGELIAVGGPLSGDEPPSILKRSSGTWRPLPAPAGFRGAAWWAWAPGSGSGSGDVWVVGEDLQVARGAPDALALVPIPPIESSTKATLFGVWGSGPGDVWMVGGSALDRSGPQGVVLHWDGASISRVPLTGTASAAASATLYKVWGSGPDDVWIAGTGGTLLRWDGRAFSLVPSGTNARLLTVHGRGAGEVYAVGGDARGVVLRFDGASWVDIAGPDVPPLSGVSVAPDGTVFACGSTGYLARRVNGAWEQIDTGLFGRDFHGAYAREGEVFVAGGQLVLEPGPRKGIIGRWGTGP